LIKGIIFDAYGTLINTGGGSIQAAQRILEKNKKDVDAKIFTKNGNIIIKTHRFFEIFCSRRRYIFNGFNFCYTRNMISREILKMM